MKNTSLRLIIMAALTIGALANVRAGLSDTDAGQKAPGPHQTHHSGTTGEPV
jgi:hypothetical protein